MSKAIGLTEGGESATDTLGSSGVSVDGTISLGTVYIRPIGISPSIGVALGEHWFRGNQWPPENTEPPSANRAPPWTDNINRHFTPVEPPPLPAGSPVLAKMPPRGWSSDWYAQVLLTEFAQVWKPAAAIQAALSARLAAALAPAEQDKERHNLIELIEFRAGVLDEVLSQMTTFEAYFQGALGYTSGTHPCTSYLFQGAMQAAGFVVMYYKNMFQRARPWQLWPELMPPVAVPGHASFPSGHSIQTHTCAAVLQTVAAGVVPSVIDITTRLAQRIARGREVLGLHYPSDTRAGEFLATEVAANFLACPTVHRLVVAAQQEWWSYVT
jgi:hypothetical protein